MFLSHISVSLSPPSSLSIITKHTLMPSGEGLKKRAAVSPPPGGVSPGGSVFCATAPRVTNDPKDRWQMLNRAWFGSVNSCSFSCGKTSAPNACVR